MKKLLLLVMAVVLVGCGLAKAKKRAEEIKCQNNMSNIGSAKLNWAIENNATDGAAVTLDDIKDLFNKAPECAAGGKYELGAVGESPSCSFHGRHK